MKIVVTVKQVPDPNSTQSLESDHTLARDKEVVLDPGDECGVEEGLQLKEAHGGEVVLVSMGPERAKDAIRKGLSMGADRGILITDASLAGPLDPGAVTRTLDALRASRDAFTLRTERRRIAGVDADCVVSEPKVAGTGSASTLCLSREGAVLLGSGALLKAVRYTTRVPASELQLPAEPEP